ncbi:hypothetical protein K474DRAFT_1712293 [Panus rudis PR-1116 ss-1]|nr:hypothetical protein K474DRAFT_1712293 [Panus rudis PR-1116 ss-1]
MKCCAWGCNVGCLTRELLHEATQQHRRVFPNDYTRPDQEHFYSLEIMRVEDGKIMIYTRPMIPLNEPPSSLTPPPTPVSNEDDNKPQSKVLSDSSAISLKSNRTLVGYDIHPLTFIPSQDVPSYGEGDRQSSNRPEEKKIDDQIFVVMDESYVDNSIDIHPLQVEDTLHPLIQSQPRIQFPPRIFPRGRLQGHTQLARDGNNTSGVLSFVRSLIFCI